MKPWGALDREVEQAAALLTARLGPPSLGVVLGSGWRGLARALGCGESVPREAIPGMAPATVAGHAGGCAAAADAVWVFLGRVHLYEGRSPAEVVHPIRILAAAGARGVVLTCAAGGLEEEDRPGDFAVVRDHINLSGRDPVAEIPAELRDPAFLDLQDAYDSDWAERVRLSLESVGARVRSGVLAAMRGPCYETPAEVRMIRALGGDLAAMSTVPEVVAGRYLGLRVAAVACISNRAAGLDASGAIRHESVLDIVRRASETHGAGFARALGVLASTLRGGR